MTFNHISRTEGLMCGTNRRYMGDYGMAMLSYILAVVSPCAKL